MSNTSEKTLICIGGGELKAKETLKIDGYIAEKAKSAPENGALTVCLFRLPVMTVCRISTASEKHILRYMISKRMSR